MCQLAVFKTAWLTHFHAVPVLYDSPLLFGFNATEAVPRQTEVQACPVERKKERERRNDREGEREASGLCLFWRHQ